MKKVNNCVVENCIPTPSSCVEWNGGDIEYLGICNGDSLNNLLWETINKLEEIAGQDLSEFDIDSLLEICNQKAPQEVTLISILTLLRDNQVCLKDYIDALNEKLNELLVEQDVNVNLKCYANFDNLGNSLSITRDQLDQLIIDNLCNHKDRIETLEGKVTTMQSQIDNMEINPVVQEPYFATCIDSGTKTTSEQTKSTAEALCDLRDATGTSTEIITALGQTPADFDTDFSLVDPGNWIPAINRNSWADNYNNLLIAFGNVVARLKFIEENCCALSCDEIKLGFSAVMNEDGTELVLSFTWGAGTVIPAGIVDKGSTGVITDIDGNTVSFNAVIANNAVIEVSVVGLNLTGELTIDLTAKLGNDSLTCEKCLHKTVRPNGCAYCTISNTGVTGDIVITYEETIAT